MNWYILLVCIQLVAGLRLSQYYYPGQSGTTNDVNGNASLVIVAFATINSDGTITMPSPPCSLISQWQSLGKKVLFSIGGQNANWTSIFASNTSMNASINSISQLLTNSPFQGVDIDYQSYGTSPFIMGPWLQQLKISINGAYLVITPQCVGVYQGQPVPTIATWNTGQYWNYWVPILTTYGSFIDGVQVQAYNNWYDNLTPGSLQFLQDVTLQWLNRPSPLCAGCSIIPNFTGVAVPKLIIGIPASPSAGSGYPSPSTLNQYIAWLSQQNLNIAGMMMWDSHWDSLNGYIASTTITQQAIPSPLVPTKPTNNAICSTNTTTSKMKFLLVK